MARRLPFVYKLEIFAFVQEEEGPIAINDTFLHFVELSNYLEAFLFVVRTNTYDTVLLFGIFHVLYPAKKIMKLGGAACAH